LIFFLSRKRYAVRHLALLFLMILLIQGFPGCTREPAAVKGGPTPVTLQLNWLPEPQFGGIYEARLKGIFEAEGLKVEVRPGAAGVSAPQLADNGNVEFSIVGGSQILQLNDRGGDLVALFAVYQHDPHGIMVPENSKYTNLKQLWGDPNATIGCEADLAFLREITRVFGTDDGAMLAAYNLPAFRAGRQQASQCFVTSEPVSLELDGFKTRVFMASESGFDPYNTVLVTRRAYLESDPEICAAMVRAFSRGWAGYLASPDATNQELARLNPGMSMAVLALSAKKQIPLIKDAVTARDGLGAMSTERWQRLADQLKSLGVLDQVPDVTTIYRWKGQ
jgi:NitT/TauT family transport system substrate-binding protein